MAAEIDERSGRERILDVAARSFLENGYEGTSLRQIADTVGIKAGSIYYHFASKDVLLLDVLRRGIEVMNVAFDEASRATADAGVEHIIGTHVRAHLAALFENGAFTAAHVTTFRTAPAAVRSEIVAWRDRYEARWTELFTTLHQRGDLAPAVDISLARLTLFGAMNSAVEWFDPQRGNLDQYAATITQQFLYGVTR